MLLHTHVDTHVHSGTVLKGESISLHVLGQGQQRVFPVGSVLRNPAPVRAFLSFTSKLAVEAREPDGKGLKCTQRVAVVQGEHVVLHTAKLHDYVVG